MEICRICLKEIEEKGLPIPGFDGPTGYLHRDCLMARVYQVAQDPNLQAVLRILVDYEEKHPSDFAKNCSQGLTDACCKWSEVSIPAARINKLVTSFVVAVIFSSRSSTHYSLIDRGIVKDVLAGVGSASEAPTVGGNGDGKIPDDLFEPIIGYKEKKTIVLYALQADERVNVLFTGVPSSAKSLFLMELRRLPNCYYAVAPTLTGAGLADLLFAYEPRILLLDEIERIHAEDFGSLNSLMETGIVSETKFNKTRSMVLKTKVFAAGVYLKRLPSDFLSRFVTLYFPPYTEREFIEISARLLSMRERVSEDIASFISHRVWGMGEDFHDVRQCVYVARMAGNSKERAQQILGILGKQRKPLR